MKRAYIGFLFCLTVFVAALVPLTAYALTFTRGEKLGHTLSVCLDRADAVAILETHAKSGFDAANALWEASPNCATVPVVGPFVGKVVFAISVQKDGKEVTARVVEIVNDKGEVLGFFVTTAPVNGRPELKKERDS